ncbi:MAG: hypothetical protein V5A49_03580 [Haloarcula sp.]
MDTPTLLEVEVERDAVASVLGAVPGVAVVDDDTAGPSPDPAGPDGADESGPGLMDRLKSLWRQWGLLGTGLSLMALGAATAGLWWYRRRNADGPGVEGTDEYASEWDADSPGETPPPAEPTAGTPSPTGTDIEPTAPAEAADEFSTPGTQETALASEMPQTEPGYRQQDTGGDTEPAGAAGSATGAEDETQRAETDADETQSAETDADDRPEAKIDPAPLLGAAFLVLSSALGRWATRDRTDQP